MLTAITVKMIMQWNSCEDYSEERVRQLFGDRESVSLLEVCNAEHIPVVDRLWLLLREEIIPAPVLHEFACWCAERALPAWEKRCPGDNRPRLAIEAKRAWLRGGETDEELAAARSAACGTTARVARYAAVEAARYASVEAARVAAVEVARDAARSEMAVAWHDEQAAQLARVREIILEQETASYEGGNHRRKGGET